MEGGAAMSRPFFLNLPQFSLGSPSIILIKNKKNSGKKKNTDIPVIHRHCGKVH